MKKIFYLLLLCLCFCGMTLSEAFADIPQLSTKKVIVKLNQDVSSKNPPKIFKVVVNDNYTLTEDKTIEKGTEVTLKVVEAVPEKIGKQDAYLKAKVINVYVPTNNKTIVVKNPDAIVKISKYEKVDIANSAVDTGITVANFFVKNVTYPAHFAKGVIVNKEGNRLESGIKETYNSSVFSYAGKGEAINVKAGTLMTMSFSLKSDKSAD